MANTLTVKERWEILQPGLDKAGIDTSKISGLHIATVVGQAENDEVVGEDEDVWREWAEWLVEKHPGWAKPGFWRLKHAEALLDNWQSGVFGDPESEATVEELVKGKYALVSWYDKSSVVYACGDSYRDILATICGITYESDSPEHADFYVDLDTGEQYNLYTNEDPKMRIKTTITLELGGESYTNQSQE